MHTYDAGRTDTKVSTCDSKSISKQVLENCRQNDLCN